MKHCFVFSFSDFRLENLGKINCCNSSICCIALFGLVRS